MAVRVSPCDACTDRFMCLCFSTPEDCPLDSPCDRQESIRQETLDAIADTRFFRGVGYAVYGTLIVSGLLFAGAQFVMWIWGR